MKILPINDDLLYVHYRNTDDFVKASGLTNVVLAAYTTAHARLKLYSYLEQLGDRVYYVDTDSTIWLDNVNDVNEYKVPIGNFLGDMTDELEAYGRGSFISSFVSEAPKFYAFDVVTPGIDVVIEICKLRRFTLNYLVKRDKINKGTIKSLVLGRIPEIAVESQNIRCLEPHYVITRTEEKICKVTCMKRRFIRNDYSLPYGYKRMHLE